MPKRDYDLTPDRRPMLAALLESGMSRLLWHVMVPILLIAGIFVCLLELSFPILIWPKRTRLPCLIAIITMHIGIGVMMGLYLFSLVMIVLDFAAFGPGLLRRYPTTEMTPKVAKRDS